MSDISRRALDAIVRISDLAHDAPDGIHLAAILALCDLNAANNDGLLQTVHSILTEEAA